MPLVVCETINGGLLREAAIKKKDERILIQLRDKDCVAIEVRYHRKCYTNYTNFLRRQHKEESDSANTPLYNAGYEQFCNEVVEELIKNKQITFMSHLYSNFVKIVQRVEGLDASSFRKFRLKERLTNSYPQLVFVTPKRRCVSEIVFAENLCPTDVMGDVYDLHVGSDSDDEDDNSDEYDADVKATEPTVNEAQILYHASMLLKEKIASTQGLRVPWPPVAADISIENVREIVTPTLFNFVAWTLGFSEEEQIDYYVAVTDKQKSRIYSLVQDMILISSDGKKFTPKSLSLTMAMRQLTGSSKVINLLNQFGHCLSNNFALRHETGLAELSISEGGVVPVGVRKNQNIAIAWDNDDFLEDTKTGKDTTHVTGGIIIQRDNGKIESESTCTSRKNIPRASSLKHVPDQIAPFTLGKRVTVDLRNALEDTNIHEKAHEQQQSYGKKLDFSFIMTRMLQTDHLPNWTGYNTLLAKESIPQSSKVMYLPIIDASATEFSTISAVLQRSMKIADELGLQYVSLVFDEAIYAKIQQIRWKDVIYMDRFIIRMGAFHMAMSFCGAIAKLFGDGGLKVCFKIMYMSNYFQPPVGGGGVFSPCECSCEVKLLHC